MSQEIGYALHPKDAGVIPVELGTRSYDVLVDSGIFDNAVELIEGICGRRKCGIITDAHVGQHYLGRLERGLDNAGLLAGSCTVASGEASKSFETMEHVTRSLLKMGLERNDLVIALGGGVIGDLAGFAASVVRRGMGFVQIPTSLLAQVDSSVGGKTGINTPEGKNLIGAFHQPSLVIADTCLLDTLPDRQLRAGYAEVVKYGLLGDADFFAWLEQNGRRMLARETSALVRGITRSIEMKAEIVARDETEQGDRALLNLGHTFGHALEAWAGFSDRLYHGEAVSIGMCQAFRYALRRGLCPKQDVERAEAVLSAAGLPVRISDIQGNDRPSCAQIMTLMSQDKKVQNGRLTLILADRIGHAFVEKGADQDDVAAFVAEEIDGPYALS